MKEHKAEGCEAVPPFVCKNGPVSQRSRTQAKMKLRKIK